MLAGGIISNHITRHGSANYGTASQALISATRTGDVEALRQLLDGEPRISKARIVDPTAASRTLLHIAVDWPGHFPFVSQTIGLLINRGANPDAALVGGNALETPLHGAASSNDVNAWPQGYPRSCSLQTRSLEGGRIFNRYAAKKHGIRSVELRGRALDTNASSAILNKAEFIVAHNAPFDKRFVTAMFGNAGSMKWHCTMTVLTERPWTLIEKTFRSPYTPPD